MLSRLRPSRPSPAILVAVVALVAAVAGTAVADPVANTSAINKKKVKKIANKAAAKAVDAQFPIQESQIADGAVSGAKIADGGVGSADLGANSVGAAKVADNSLGANDLALDDAAFITEATTIADDGTAADNTVNTARVAPDCPAGHQAIAGGGNFFGQLVTTDLNLYLTESTPQTGFDGWIVGGSNDTGEAQQMTGYVICIRK
jgi:hypothetical protein